MAHDSSHRPPGDLDPETIAAVQAALTRLQAGRDVSPELSGALRSMALEAREKQMRPERLLVTLKSIWARVPEVKRSGDSSAQARMLESLVTLSIREYYAPDAAP
ncbi:MAG: hypothetical protein NVS1B4_03240 [Gemmatimonadaceae bacterium]